MMDKNKHAAVVIIILSEFLNFLDI
jgi:hypothetical protein